MAKLKLPHPDYLKHKGQDWLGFDVRCPGCKYDHRIMVNYGIQSEKQEPKWTFNNNLDKPTFSPSLLCREIDEQNNVKYVCHSFIRDGQWQYLSDCTHLLAGKTVDMIDI